VKVLVYDIETVPDTQSGRRLLGLGDDLPDADIVRALEQIQFQKNGRTFLPHHLHRIVSISLLLASASDEPTLWSLDGDEAEILERFFTGIDQYAPQLVSWNGAHFDLPVIHYRSLLHGIIAPRYWETGEEEREFRFNNYLNRYHWRHLDLMDVLSLYDYHAAASLDNISKLIGAPGKQGMDGGQVWEAFQAGERERISNYCETDVLNTYLVFLRFEMMRGRIGREACDERCRRLREMLEASGKPHLEEFAALMQQ